MIAVEYLISQGHVWSDVRNYTPAQLAMFAKAAVRRRDEDLLTQVNIQAAAASSGFHGSTKPLEDVERAIRGTTTSYGNELQKRLRQVAVNAGVKVEKHGPNRR